MSSRIKTKPQVSYSLVLGRALAVLRLG